MNCELQVFYTFAINYIHKTQTCTSAIIEFAFWPNLLKMQSLTTQLKPILLYMDIDFNSTMDH